MHFVSCIKHLFQIKHYKKKRIGFTMVSITKGEKEAISKQFPNAHIVRTMKQKSKRHHYYCEETKPVMRFLNKIRANGGVNTSREGGHHTDRKNAKRVAT